MMHEQAIFIISLLQASIPIIVLAVSCIVFILLPQQQQQYVNLALRKNLRIGRHICTMHGLTGIIVSLSENFIIIQHDDGRKSEILAQTIIAIDHEPYRSS